jgi:hypothetical protein
VSQLTNYLLLTSLLSNAIDFPGGNISTNKYNISGSAGQLITSRACNSVNTV